jgi:hypothetical protein
MVEKEKPIEKDYSKFEKVVGLLKKNDKVGLERAIGTISNTDKPKWIYRLERYRYKKYPLAIFAINKLKNVIKEKPMDVNKENKIYTSIDGDLPHKHKHVVNDVGNGRTTIIRGKEPYHFHEIRKWKVSPGGMDGHSHDIVK